jgi:hypothetical protein
MFIENKYTKTYYQIIERARNRTLLEYKEKHHIIPKSLNGPDESFNIVSLTAREHFICHWLLTKMVTGKRNQWKMINALGLMMWKENKNQKRYKVNSRTYELLKQKHSEYKSWANSGEKNGMFGRKWTEEQKEKIRKQNTGWQPTEEMKSKISLSKLGKSRSDETRKKISETKLKNKSSKGQNNPMYGKKHSPETIEKMRQAALKRKKSNKENS